MRPLDASIQALGVALTLTTTAKAQTIIHVDDDAPNNGDGSTWESAFNDLQDAIATIDAVNNPGAYEIRIADGTYRPDRGTGDRWQAFKIGNDELQSAVTLKIRGGFAGLLSLTDPDRQDPSIFKSVLDGDLNGDDLPGFGNRVDNSRTVLDARADLPFALEIDGLVVRGATGSRAVRSDGFMRYTRCEFIDNSSSIVFRCWRNQQLIGCAFEHNRFSTALQVSRNNDIINCSFIGNENVIMALDTGNILQNCLMYANGPASRNSARVDLFNSILWANGDGSFEDQIGVYDTSHCIVQGDKGHWGNIADFPEFIDELGPDNIPLTGDENFALRYISPARDAALPGILPSDVTDLDNDGDLLEPIPIDLAHNARVLNRSIDIGPFEICTPDTTGSSDPRDPTYNIPDGDTDADDWFFFLDMFSLLDERADLTGSSDPDDPDWGIPDGNIGVDDYFFFLDAFARGCDPE